MLGVESLLIAGLAEAVDPQTRQRRGERLSQELGDGAAQTAYRRVVLDRDDVSRASGRRQRASRPSTASP